MKKKSLALLFVLLIIATLLCFSLVGCVSNKYDFSKFFGDSKVYDINTSYSLEDRLFNNDVVNYKYLTGCLYEIECKTDFVGNNKYILYDVVAGKQIIASRYDDNFGEISVIKNYPFDIVVKYSAAEYSYTYFLPDGQIIYKSEDMISPSVRQLDGKSYCISFNFDEKVVNILDYGYVIVGDESNVDLTQGSYIGSNKNAYYEMLAKKFGLGKNYKIDYNDGVLIVMKNNKIVSRCDVEAIERPVAFNNASILYCVQSEVPEDSKDYNVIYQGRKMLYQLKSIDLKSGKTKNVKTEYVIDDLVQFGSNGDVLVTGYKINKDKTLSKTIDNLVVNGKGVVAIVNNSFAAIDDVYRWGKNEFLINTNKGLYLTDKNLNVKNDFTQVKAVEVFASNNAIVASSVVDGKLKYGVIAINKKTAYVRVPFVYDSYYSVGNGLYFSYDSGNKENDCEVYYVNDLSMYKSYGQYDYMENDIVCYNDTLFVASKGELIMTKPSLTAVDCQQMVIGDSKAFLFKLSYKDNTNRTAYTSLVYKMIKTEKNN